MRVAVSILVALSVLALIGLAHAQNKQEGSGQEVGLSESGVVKTQAPQAAPTSNQAGTKKSKDFYFYRKWVVKMIFCTLRGNEARNKFTRLQMERKRKSAAKNRLVRQRWYIQTQLKDVQERGTKRAAQEARDKDQANRKASDASNTKANEAGIKAGMAKTQQAINQNQDAATNRIKLDQDRQRSKALVQQSRDQSKSEQDFKKLSANNQKTEKQLKARQQTLARQLEQANEALKKAKEQNKASRQNLLAKAKQEKIALRKRKQVVRQLLVSDAAAKKDVKNEADQKNALRVKLQKELQDQFNSDQALHKSKAQIKADAIRIENKGAAQKVKLQAAAANLSKKLQGLKKRFQALLNGVNGRSPKGVERAWKREVQLQKRRKAKANRKYGPTKNRFAAAQNAFRNARVREQQLRMETEKTRDLVHRKRSEFSAAPTQDRSRLNAQYSAALTKLKSLESKTRDARRAAMKAWLRFRKLKLKSNLLRRKINFQRRVALRTARCNAKIENNRKTFMNEEKNVPADIVDASKAQGNEAAARTSEQQTQQASGDKVEGGSTQSQGQSQSETQTQTQSQSSQQQDSSSSSSSDSGSGSSSAGNSVQVAKDRFKIDLADWRRKAKKDEELMHSKDVEWQFDELDARDFEGREEEELQETAHKKLIINRIYDINDKNLDQDAERDASVFNAAVHDAWFKKRAEALKAQQARQQAWKQQQAKKQQQQAVAQVKQQTGAQAKQAVPAPQIPVPAQAQAKAQAAARQNPVASGNKLEQKTRFFEMQRAEHDLKATREYATRALQKNCAGGKCGNLQSAVDQVLQNRL